MFTSSTRRVALTSSQTPIIPCLTTPPRAAASQALSYRSHQRRCSSSKPSSPADGSKKVADGQVPTAQTQTQPDGEKRSSGRKAEDVTANCTVKGRNKAMQNLPSVPSTNHIPPTQIAASRFFSLHRPISLTINFPKAVTDDAFAAIFTSRTKSNAKPAEVISTLSSTVRKLESVTGDFKQLNTGNQQAQWNAETDELRAAITAESYRKAETQHLDTPPMEAAMNFPRHILSGRYQPFNPPPAPVPMDTAESLAAGAEAAEAQEPQYRTYTSILTLEESTNELGEVTYVAHSSPFQEDPRTPTRFHERMQIRQERSRERAAENGMWAISVKRQRKLKMKKHKYKKLMRRTRNLRRRLDRN